MALLTDAGFRKILTGQNIDAHDVDDERTGFAAIHDLPEVLGGLDMIAILLKPLRFGFHIHASCSCSLCWCRANPEM